MIGTAPSYADKFLHALAIRDFASLGETFAPEVQFRALIPAGLREARSGLEARNHYQQWFSDLERFEMVGHTVMPVASRTHIAYRLHFIHEGMPKVWEQRIFLTVGENGIEKFDLLCSGFLPRHE
ncbi:MAG: hypothetical protein WBX25_34630 [Rhodomicrobium sp.]